MQDSQAIGIFIFVFASVGIFGNLTVLFLSRRVHSLRNSFGILIRTEASAALLFSAVFSFYVAPVLVFNLKFAEPLDVSRHFGHLVIFLHDVCLFSHFVISLNRMTAAYLPVSYNSMFSDRTTVRLCVIVIMAAALATAVHAVVPCALVFDFNAWFFYYQATDCGRILSINIQFPRNLILILICVAVDVATYLKLRFLRQDRNFATNSLESKRRHDIEIGLISQVLLQGSLYVVEFCTYFVMSAWYTDKYLVFALTTVSWMLIHVSDGFLVIAFNHEFRRVFRSTILRTTRSEKSLGPASGTNTKITVTPVN